MLTAKLAGYRDHRVTLNLHSFGQQVLVSATSDGLDLHSFATELDWERPESWPVDIVQSALGKRLSYEIATLLEMDLASTSREPSARSLREFRGVRPAGDRAAQMLLAAQPLPIAHRPFRGDRPTGLPSTSSVTCLGASLFRCSVPAPTCNRDQHRQS